MKKTYTLYALCACIIIISNTASATVTYAYTGSTFSNIQDSPVPSGNLAGVTNLILTLEFNSAFSSGFSGAVNPLSWSISDGLKTLTNSDSFYWTDTNASNTFPNSTSDVYGTISIGANGLPSQWSLYTRSHNYYVVR